MKATSQAAQDKEAAENLWKKSEEWSKLHKDWLMN